MTVQHNDPAPIKQLLTEWARYHIDHPEQVPGDVKRLDEEISRLNPKSVRVLELQYCDPRPQKVKAAILQMSRQIFSAHLRWVHDQLSFALKRNSVS
jgi:hypothetical protein